MTSTPYARVRRALAAGATLATVLALITGPAAARAHDAAAYLDEVRGRPALLEDFVRLLPKGGDLHTHLAGVPYAESYLRWAVDDGGCVELRTWKISLGHPGRRDDGGCDDGWVPASELLASPALLERAVNGLSMRGFPLAPPGYGHDHFFDAFGLFGDVSGRRKVEELAEATRRAAADRTGYLELLVTFQSELVTSVAGAVTLTRDLAADHAEIVRRLERLGAVEAARRELEALIAGQRRILGCEDARPPPACAVTVRFLQQGPRTTSKERVLVSLTLGAELTARDPRMVGVDLVGPEDSCEAMYSYDRHMEMVGFLRERYPTLRVALHAGELPAAVACWQVAPPFRHVHGAVLTAHADRIGHGVALRSEPGWEALLATMAARRVGVAVLLTSNAQILGVEGAAHPFETYRAAGVPVMLATDDQGISRGSHSGEFVRAIGAYGLSWADVRRLVRTSLEQSFARGPSLWRSFGPEPVAVAACAGDRPGVRPASRACQAFLDGSDRAREQWRLEEQLAEFEARAW